jgi:hypothetical protein
VRRETHASLDEAVRAMESAVEEVRDEGGLPTVKMLREFEPGDRVAARIEISSGGWLRGRTAGVDVMGDGSLVPFSGGVRRSGLDVLPDEPPLDAVRRELAG